MFLFSIFLFIYASQILLYLYYYNYKYSNKEELIELKYDDLYHISREKKGYLVVTLSFDKINSNTLKDFKERFKIINEKFVINKLEFTKSSNILKKNDLNFEQNFNRITLGGYQPKNNQDLINKTHQSKNLVSLVLNQKNNTISCCWNHGIMDGIGMMEYILCFLRIKKGNHKKLPLFKNNFFLLSYSLILTALNYNRLTKKRIPSLFNDSEESRIFSFSMDIKNVNSIIQKKNCSFNGAIQSIIFNYLYDFCQSYSVATIIGGEKTCYFNNHGVIPYRIDLNKNKENIPKNIDYLLNQNKFIVPVTLNKFISSFIKKKKNTIDIMFSGVPFSKEKLYLGESFVEKHMVFIPYHLVPMYVFSCKMEDRIHFSVGVRDKKLKKFLEKYNWEVTQ